MRIAFFSDNFEPELSGIKKTIIITGKELRKRGHEVCYVGPRYAPKDYAMAGRSYPKNRKDDTIDGIPIVRLPSFPILSPTGQSRFAIPLHGSLAFMKEFKPDVIHTQSPYGTGWEAIAAAKKFRVPLVGTNHTAVEDFFPLPSIMRAYDAWYYNHCDYVTTPYEGLITRMREKGFRRLARAVANPVELEHFSPATTEEKMEQKRLFNAMGPTMVYVGRLAAEKRVDVVIRAVALLAKKFPTLAYIAVGHGAAENGLKKLARELGVSGNVRFPGYLSDADVPSACKAADVFAMMSTSDSQSIALMQAYATGIPAVCARARGLPDYTPAECGFLVEPGNHTALAEKLSLLLTDDALREKMGKAAQAFVAQFSPENVAKEWEQIYTDAIQHKF